MITPALPTSSIARLNRRSCGGFSLVEVTLAVAVASLALITLLGLLPQGLEMSRKTGLMTSNSNILEQITHDLENAQWSTFTNNSSTEVRRYFNDQGMEVKADSKEISFVASLDFSQAANLPSSGDTQQYLKRVIIKVAASGNKDFQFGENNRISYVTFNHLIAKTR